MRHYSMPALLLMNDVHMCLAENDSGKGHGNNMHGLVGVSHASPPPSAFASAQPPRSVFADAQLPPSDSEAETENGSSPAPGTTIRAHGAARRTSSQVCMAQCLLGRHLGGAVSGTALNLMCWQ